MRSYHIDEIRPEDISRINDYLTGLDLHRPLPGLFWLPLPQEALTEEQAEHTPECGSHVLSIELGEDWVRLEFLVRASQRMRCSCVQYATKEQRDFALAWMDSLLADLEILT